MRPNWLISALILALAVLSFLPHTPPVSLAATAVATQAGNPDCDPAGLIKKLAALKPSGNQDTDLAALATIEGQISAVTAACSGLSFKGDAEARLIGPFELPQGSYKVTVTTPGFLVLTAHPISGACDTSTDMTVVNITGGEATTGQESLFTSVSCKIILVPSNVTEPWTATFELLPTQ